MKIEQSLLDRFIAVRSSELTAEQITQYFDGLTLEDLQLTAIKWDGNNNRAVRGVMVCKSRKWRAIRVAWTNTAMSSMIKPDFLDDRTLAEFLTEVVPGKLHVIPSDNRGQMGHICIPSAAGQSYDQETLMSLLGALTGYDFTDMGTLKDEYGKPCHVIETFPNPTIEDSVIPDISMNGRVDYAYRISGPIAEGIVLFVNDGYHQFQNDVDIGVLPGELPTT
ncbi:hypothetical protein RISINGSUN_151 [Erwinia phage vB_EamM_RisingSun]|uniref:Uncharacterized protein n=2 Tax=Risingsunvirus risingsun TaxID=2560435 RepID=A0A223LJ43_9CAUD|nr:hypothetical protein FDI45_gp151 [Erwinia phage vB_EamM_RisingSun]ASU03519.1 hypothetical protein RISINGSUN_151 [Erwinia phage vB_EamM_RisingSun]ASU03763.1 hypothetical protein JOAD_152 [Erwinia phage vB_EamM_Joad]